MPLTDNTIAILGSLLAIGAGMGLMTLGELLGRPLRQQPAQDTQRLIPMAQMDRSVERRAA